MPRTRAGFMDRLSELSVSPVRGKEVDDVRDDVGKLSDISVRTRDGHVVPCCFLLTNKEVPGADWCGAVCGNVDGRTHHPVGFFYFPVATR